MWDYDELEELWLQHADKIFEIFKLKNRKYTPENIAKVGTNGVLFKMVDKFSRLSNLLATGDNGTPDESILDTVYDLADYAIIMAMLLNHEWPEATTKTTTCPCCGKELGD